jgi:hypothetical protein
LCISHGHGCIFKEVGDEWSFHNMGLELKERGMVERKATKLAGQVEHFYFYFLLSNCE